MRSNYLLAYLLKSFYQSLSTDASAGGTLGFWCSHIYAYNHTEETPLPATLKGVDAVLWESCQALNLDPKIAPVIRMSEYVREMLSEWYKVNDLSRASMDEGWLG